jgi:SOS-response transcriptional repressor LexA
MSQTLAHRLKSARKARDWTQEDLAKRSGVLQSDISKIERGQTLRPLGLLALASALQCDPYWLETGNEHKIPLVGNVTPAKARSKVPLISWVAAGSWGEVTDMFQPGEAEEWIEAYESSPSSSAFALRVDGDSMKNQHGEPSFPDGTIILVDPNRSAQAGDFVVAKDVSTQKATFKKLMHDAGRWYLKPLNSAYPTIEIDDPAIRVIGRVVEYRTGGKL